MVCRYKHLSSISHPLQKGQTIQITNYPTKGYCSRNPLFQSHKIQIYGNNLRIGQPAIDSKNPFFQENFLWRQICFFNRSILWCLSVWLWLVGSNWCRKQQTPKFSPKHIRDFGIKIQMCQSLWGTCGRYYYWESALWLGSCQLWQTQHRWVFLDIFQTCRNI